MAVDAYRRSSPHSSRTVEASHQAGLFPDRLHGGLAALLLLGSGASALVYQVLWVKQLSLVVGVDVHAVTIGVSAFFAGLALGNALFGSLADRLGRPVVLYACLEVGIAALGIGSTLALAHAVRPFVSLQSAVGPLAWTLPFAIVGLPALLMGGTLPALIRATDPDDSAIGRASGLLYGANTAGAVAGALATPFLLLPALGVRGTSLTAATLNLTLATGAGFLGRFRAPHRIQANPREPLPRAAKLAIVLYALAGAVALGYEVVWSQAIVQFLSTRAYAFATVLATYLTGLVIGSLAYAWVADRVQRPWMVFGLLIASAGATAVVVFAGLEVWLIRAQDALGTGVLNATGREMLRMSARFALAAVVLVLAPTVLLGAAFPAAMRLVAGKAHIGRDTGAVTALNTGGGIAGTILTGFGLVTWFGFVHTLGVLAVAAALLGGIAIVYGARRRTAAVILVTAIVALVGTAALSIPADKLAKLLASARGGRVDFYQESAGGAVAVLEQRASHTSFRRLYIQGVSNSGDAMTSLRYMRLQALLPLMIHRGEPRSALVVGLGTGITAGALLTYPDLEHRVVAELLPAVVAAATRFQGNFGAARDPRILIRLGDGRHELLRSDRTYDLITLEPPPPSAAGVVNLYSRDFYELCSARLAPNGLLAQWWPLPTQNDEDSRSLLRSILDVFPHVTAWSTELHEMLVIGSMQPIELDVPRITRRLARGAVAVALREVGVASPAALLATYVTDRAGLGRYVGDAPAVTDDRPRIEFADWVRRGEFERVLPRVLEIATVPPLLRADETFENAVDSERRRLMMFYQAGLDAYAGDREAWAKRLAQVVREDPHNPYYLWLIGARPAGLAFEDQTRTMNKSRRRP